MTYEKQNVTEKQAKNYDNSSPQNFTQLDCQCVEEEPYYSGPQADDEDFYNKDQIAYEDALPNLIFVS